MKPAVASMVRLRRLRRDTAESRLVALRQAIARARSDMERLTSEIDVLVADEPERYRRVVEQSSSSPYPSQIGIRLAAERAAFESESSHLKRLRKNAIATLELLSVKEAEACRALKKAEQQKTKWEEIGQREHKQAKVASVAQDEAELDDLNTSLGD